ncbi:MAG: hypothetical protein K0R52_617 [Alphaproteobacteria bacterium]|nr:hypothetical protein [Alphaproteobacteria bacterium]
MAASNPILAWLVDVPLTIILFLTNGYRQEEVAHAQNYSKILPNEKDAVMYLLNKSYPLTFASTVALTFSLLKPSHALEETWESRRLVESGRGIGAVQAVRLQEQAILATTALTGNTNADTVNTLPAAVFSVNAALDGVCGLTNLTSFIVTTPATNAGGTVNIVGHDGSPGQTYSMAFSSPIAPSGTITLTNGNKSITFVNNSGASIASASELAAYLAEAHPLNFLISNTTSDKIAAISGLFDDAANLQVQAIEAASAVPVNREVNARLDGVQSVSGLSSFTVTTAATDVGGTVRIVGDDGALGQTYAVVYASPIAPNGTMTLSNGGKSITFVNRSGATITSAAALAAYLAGSYPLNSVISDTTVNKATALLTALGGENYNAMGRVMDIGASLVLNPSGVLAPDIETLAGQIVLVPSGVLETDWRVLNSLLDGAAAGSTTQSRIVTLFGNVDGSDGSAGNITSKLNGQIIAIKLGAVQLSTAIGDVNSLLDGAAAGSTTQARLVTLFGNVDGSDGSAGNITSKLSAQIIAIKPGTVQLSTAIGGVNSLLDGAAAGSTTQARIVTLFGNVDGSDGSAGNITSKLSTQITAIKPDAVQLSTAVSAVNAALGGSGVTQNRISMINAALDGVQTLSGLTHFTVTTSATNVGGTISIIGNDGVAGRAYSMDATNVGDGSGGTEPIPVGATFVLEHAGSGNTVTFINNSGGVIISAGALAAYLADSYPLNFVIRGSTATKVIALRTLLGGTNSSAMGQVMDLGVSLVVNPSGALATDVETLAEKLVSVPSEVLETDLNTLSTALVGNTNFAQPLEAQVTTLSNTLDNSVSSLPNGGTYATIGTPAADDGGGGVNIVISAGLGGANGAYNLSAGTIAGGIANGSTFTLTNGGNDIVLYNRSGATLNTQAAAIRYLASMYPVGSQMAAGVSDKITNGINRLIGGVASSARARLAAVDASILNNPTGVVATDLQTANALFGGAGSTTQARIEALNSLLDGVAAGSTTQARIGEPTVNGVSSNVSAVIGGAGASVAERLGDPVTAVTGLASLITASTAMNGNNIFSDAAVAELTGATALYNQMQAFLALLNPANWANAGHTTITFDLSGGAPASIADFVNKVSGTA